MRLTGSLDVDALARSLREIVLRHDALRTIFSSVDGEPNQHVVASSACPIDIVDLGALADDLRASELRRRIADEARRPFDLARGPLLRVVLYRLAPRDHALLVTMHHIVADGWSVGVFRRELTTLYRAFARAEPSPLAPLPLQYADFARWQRQWHVGAPIADQLEYWTKQLAGASTRLRLPTDRPRPKRHGHRAAVRRATLSPGLTSAIGATSRREGVTLFMTLLAALQTLLHARTGQDDVCVGTAISGRTQVATEDLVGFFANTIVMRTDLSGAPTFRALLGRVRDAALGAYQHQDVPFERIVEALRIERELGLNPIFQAMLVLQDTPPSDDRLDDRLDDGLSLALEAIDADTTRFDLQVDVAHVGAELRLDFTYSADLFDAATIDTIVHDFQAILERLTTDPTAPIVDRSSPPAPASIAPPASAPIDRAFTAPRTETEAVLAEIWCHALGLDRVSVDSDFFAIGGRSLLAVQVFDRIKQRLGVRLPMTTIFEAPTIALLAHAIHTHAADELDRPRTQPPRDRDATPLFFAPALLGAVILPEPFARRLAADRRLHDSLRFPGFADGEPILSRVDALAAHVASAIEEIAPTGPIDVAGICFGGVVALEVARALRARGRRVEHVVLIDSYAPTYTRKRTVPEQLQAAAERFSKLDFAGRVAFLRQIGKKIISARERARVWTEEVPDTRGDDSRAAQVQRAAEEAAAHHEPLPYDGAVTLFVPDDRELFRGVRYVATPDNGWTPLVRGRLQIVRVTGGHDSMLQAPHGAALAERVLASLANDVALA
jgi:thioesterase domain-containing protein/acyl carrier protein